MGHFAGLVDRIHYTVNLAVTTARKILQVDCQVLFFLKKI